MAFLDMFRVGQIKTDLETVTQERDQLKATLASTEHMDHFALERAIEQLRQDKQQHEQDVQQLHADAARQRQQLEASFVELRQKQEQDIQRFQTDFDQKRKHADAALAEVQQRIAKAKEEIVQLDEEILLQSFGFYTPRYALQNAEEYRQRLERIRGQQEQMVKDGKAATFPANMTMNNNAREGAQMIKDNVKLILRSFNNECDASFVGVKFSNVESIEKRVRKAFTTLNTLGRRLSIAIVPAYLDLKLEELYLCHEYQLKRQEEKEEQKRIREQLREDAKVAREIEEMKLKLQKEERHFIAALQKLAVQESRATTDEERALIAQERALIEQKVADIEYQKEDVVNREQNTRAGYVYIISNIGAFGEDVYKIGVTRRLDPQERIDELGDASVPFGFDVHALIFSDNAPALEFALHKAFEARRLNMINRRREFFRVSLAEIEEVVRVNFTKPVEFIEAPDAVEFRESLQLRAVGVPASTVLK